MDPVSLTASLVAISQLTVFIVDYLGKVRDAPKERSQMAIEASNLYHLLTTLRYRFEAGEFDHLWCQAINLLAARDGPLDQYQQVLKRIKKKVEFTDGIRGMITSLLWPFSKKEVTELLFTIERMKTLIQVALEMDHLKLSQTIMQTVDAIHNSNKLIKNDTLFIKNSLPALQSKVDEIAQTQLRDAVMAWISPSDYYAVQQSDIMSKIPPGSGQWFLQSSEFTGWLEGSANSSTLFCPGIPGAGKTTIAAIAIDFLLKTAQVRSAMVAYVYCNYKSQENQSTISLLGIILKQLLRSHPTVPKSLHAMYKALAKLSSDDILRELRLLVRESAATYIVIDALDECLNNEGGVVRLLLALRDLQCEGRLCLLCTSRFIPDIAEHFETEPRLEISARGVDVRHFVTCQIYRFPRCIQKDAELQGLVINKIVEMVAGMFLLARLYVDLLLDKRTKAKVRATLDRLSQISSSIDDAYGEALERLNSQSPEDRSLATRAINWIVSAQRPLTTGELCHALSVVAGERGLDKDDIVDVEDIVSVCAGLVTIDQESDVIRLVHHTAHEYFQRRKSSWAASVQEDHLAAICLTYLSFDCFADQTVTWTPDGLATIDLVEVLELYPFLGYAARYWGVHAKSTQESVSGLAMCLLLSDTLVSFTTRAALPDIPAEAGMDDDRLDHHTTNMHVMAAFGLDFIMAQVISRQRTAALDVPDHDRRSPLTFAAEHGHEDVVRLLLDHNAKIDAEDQSGRGPLSYAASGGHQAVIQLLLQHGADANARDSGGRSPLWWSCEKGSTAAARGLLDHGGADINAADLWTGQNPLLLAARSGSKEMADLLLGQSAVNVEVSDMEGRTALWYAAEQDHHEVSRVLVENEAVGKNSKDIYGLTPLAIAALKGNMATVALLLERSEVDINSRDMYGRTPLALATGHGHAMVVEQLLARCGIEADCKDQDDWTPLLSAACEGNRSVLEALLRHGVADINATSKGGFTALSCATRRQWRDGIAILQEYRNRNPGSIKNSIIQDVTEPRQGTKSTTLKHPPQSQQNTKVAVEISGQRPPNFDVENLISRLLKAGRSGVDENSLPSVEEIRFLCIQGRKVLLSHASLLELMPPIKVCGDLRANLPALTNLIDQHGLPPKNSYLFLGNYVNRGQHSIETICLLLALKIKYPDNIFLLRGRSETRSLSRAYGLYGGCTRAFKRHAAATSAWELLSQCFDCLPIAATIGGRILAVPSGLSPDLEQLEQIRRLWRPLEISDCGLDCDLLWARAQEDISGWVELEHGVSFSFGPDVVARFMKRLDLDLICVSGSALENGYEFYAGCKLVKLFTSPNYLGEFDNAGAIMEVDEGLEYSFRLLTT